MRALNRKPIVSVVMPVFNAEQFLAEAIVVSLVGGVLGIGLGLVLQR